MPTDGEDRIMMPNEKNAFISPRSNCISLTLTKNVSHTLYIIAAIFNNDKEQRLYYN